MASSIQVTTREAAAALRISLRTAQRWAANGKLNATKNKTGRWTITLTTTSLDDFKPFQIDKAREAIEQAAILPTSRPGIYTAVSSDGTTTYLVHRAACTCPAGQKQRACYHRAAAAILAAASLTRRAA
ncbi:helix-turn-helix domain-containing protein [Streptosporangium canum]|uniref:helix-turn-helix domain-containing protein n=1 Tax=Streptosporangium canum TaxID=324952 RepID=UPI0033A420F5